MQMFITFLQGIVVGMCNVIPGVSGGTLVVIFNIYDEFLSIMSLNIKRTLKNWRFVVPILLGMACGILIFSKLITFLYTRFPVQTNYLFTGLIIGSIPLLAKYTFDHEKDEKIGFWKVIAIMAFIAIGFAIIFSFYLIQRNVTEAATLSVLPDFTWRLAFKIFAGGILGAVAMIIPGISGSLLMLIMGIYPIVISAIPALFIPKTFVHALILLLPNGIGVVIGLIGGAWLLKKLLKKYPHVTYALILGLIAGSIINIFPGFKCITSAGMGIGSVICLLTGIALAFFSSLMDKKENDKKTEDISTEIQAESTETKTE